MSYVTYQGKEIYYEEEGQGPLLVFLHGNAASGLMFYEIKTAFPNYHVVIPDFLGYGKSTLLDTFPTDFWFDQGMQVLELLKHFPNEKAILIGSSGGAISACNAALEDHSQIIGVVADSFIGESCTLDHLKHFREERMESLEDPQSKQFYIHMLGEEHYRETVIKDTEMLFAHAAKIQHYFHKPLRDIQVPTLLLGTKEDGMFTDLATTYASLCKEHKLLSYHIFEHGGHPAMLSNAQSCIDMIYEFIARIK